MAKFKIIVSLIFFITYSSLCLSNDFVAMSLKTFNERSPGVNYVIQLAVQSLVDKIHNIDLAFPRLFDVDPRKEWVKYLNINNSGCRDSQLLIQTYHERVNPKKLNEGIKLYLCGSWYGTISLIREGDQLVEIDNSQLMAGNFPRPAQEIYWKLESSISASSIIFTRNGNLKKVESPPITISEYEVSNEIVRIYETSSSSLSIKSVFKKTESGAYVKYYLRESEVSISTFNNILQFLYFASLTNSFQYNLWKLPVPEAMESNSENSVSVSM